MRGWFGVWCLLTVGSACGADYYVDVDSRGGPCNDTNPGTLEKPWRTLSRATEGQEPRPQAGDTIWVRGGVYPEQVTLWTGGTPDQPLTIRAFPGEKPVIDGEGQRAEGIRLPAEGGADDVEVFILPAEGAQVYQFAVNALGTQSDNFGNQADWKAAAQRGEAEWIVELFIPYRALGVEGPPGWGLPWGMQFGRQQKPKGETTSWTPGPAFIAREGFGEVRFE